MPYTISPTVKLRPQYTDVQDTRPEWANFWGDDDNETEDNEE